MLFLDNNKVAPEKEKAAEVEPEQPSAANHDVEAATQIIDNENGAPNDDSVQSDDSSDDDDDYVEETRVMDEKTRNAVQVRLGSSHLIQMRGARVSTLGFRAMLSDEKVAEVVPPARLVAMATDQKKMNSKIRSFDVIKSLYVFLLLPIHLTNLMSWVKKNDAYASTYLPYEVTDHGQEYIMVQSLIAYILLKFNSWY
jgi:hypothetical protein